MVECLEIELKKIDAFTAKAALDKWPSIHKTSIVTCTCIRVYYKPDKISAKLILKRIGSIGATRAGGRKNHVAKVKEIKGFPEQAA